MFRLPGNARDSIDDAFRSAAYTPQLHDTSQSQVDEKKSQTDTTSRPSTHGNSNPTSIEQIILRARYLKPNEVIKKVHSKAHDQYRFEKRKKQDELRREQFSELQTQDRSGLKTIKKKIDNHASAVASRIKHGALIEEFEAIIRNTMQENQHLADTVVKLTHVAHNYYEQFVQKNEELRIEKNRNVVLQQQNYEPSVSHTCNNHPFITTTSPFHAESTQTSSSCLHSGSKIQSGTQGQTFQMPSSPTPPVLDSSSDTQSMPSTNVDQGFEEFNMHFDLPDLETGLEDKTGLEFERILDSVDNVGITSPFTPENTLSRSYSSSPPGKLLIPDHMGQLPENVIAKRTQSVQYARDQSEFRVAA